jgi:serine/threonine-protein kinase
MKHELWLVVEEAFSTAIQLPPQERTGFLKAAYGDQPDVRLEVESLLKHREAAEQLSQMSVLAAAAEMLTDGDDETEPIRNVISGKYPILDGESSDGPAWSGTLGGRFIIHERLGAGGMGEVYRAEDTHLKRAVAIKRISPKFRDNPLHRKRLVKEARHASILNDPHIAAVYDVFTDTDETYLVMEFVDGNSLRAYVTGAISDEDFRNLAKQCLKGLASAHRRKIVHRDIKPENILVTTEKQLKICDFGLARVSVPTHPEVATATQGIWGTPGYMAPEVHLGSVLDPRSDVFSMGAVLYELWTGRCPFTQEAFLKSPTLAAVTPRPGSLRPGLASEFDRVIHRMLAFSPGDRYANAIEALEDLERVNAPEAETNPRFPRPLIAAIGIAFLILAIVVGNWLVTPKGQVEAGPASVFVADFENKSGDSYYDLTVTQLFALAMEQSQFLNVMPRYRVSEALARSGIPAGSIVTLPIALELAKREHARFVFWGEVQAQAQTALLILHGTDTNSGKELKVFTAAIMEPTKLPAAAQELATKARLWLGEPLAKVNQTNVPLEQATTRSAIAWERFSRAIREDSLGPTHLTDAVTLMKSAVEIDPDFALAHERLALMQSRLGNLDESLNSIRRAYELSARLTDREKYTIMGQYRNLRWEFDLALEAFHNLVVFYPYDDVGHRYYAQTLSNVLQKDDAIAEARKAVALNPHSEINRGTLTITLALANRNDEVISTLKQFRSAGFQNFDVSEGNAWLGKSDFDRAREVFEKIANQVGPESNSGRLQLAKTLIYEGRFEEAAAQLDSEITRDVQLRNDRLAVQRRNWLTWIRALEGNRTASTNAAKAILQSETGPTNVRDLRSIGVVLAESGEVLLAEQVLARLEYFLKSGFEGNFFTSAVAQVRGEIARARGQKELARRYLDPASLRWLDVLTVWSLAQVSEDIGDFQSGRNYYKEVLNREGEIIRSGGNFPGLKHLALAGAARCGLALNNRDQASKDFEQFFVTLGKYSPELPLVKSARHQQEWLGRN